MSKSNRLLLIGSQFLSKTADELSSAKVVLPWLLNGVGIPVFVSGLLVPIRESGSLLPQLIFGPWVKTKRHRKTLNALGAVIQALSILAIALLVFQSTSPIVLGTGVLVLVLVLSLARGLCSLTAKDLLGKTVEEAQRGSVSGLSASLAGVVTLGIGALILYRSQLSSDVYFVLLLTAGLCWLLGAALTSRLQEPASETESLDNNASQNLLDTLALLKTEPDFRRFILARALLAGSGLSIPFVIILAQRTHPDSFWGLGAFVIISGIASLTSGAIWGKLADWNCRRVLILAAALTSISCLAAALFSFSSNAVSMLAFFGLALVLSIAHQGVRLGRKVLLVNMAKGNRRTDYVAIANSVMGLWLLALGAASALLAQWSINASFVLFAAASALSITFLMSKNKD
ncbi:MFS transporter [Paraferrimonas sedimenticola]|uniref:MFS transporter n=1 Tax=Paraferrimonas sedimenticola TaxID=375674 RepID=A0AA37RWF0_9GAMM|nr:MFS transporter [Paraferrimonas sedimenticola]GLP96288.1 MFS transporter [Paraferrimonas sedimenticola]